MQANKCKYFSGQDDSESLINQEDGDEGFPWTGRPLGTTDLRFISATQRPHVVGIAGAADAGKTTLLCLLFLNLSRGRLREKFNFAGSYTLLGWENIAQNMQLNAGETIQFPPHTSSSGRSPGLLHLRTMYDKNRLQDSLLTDASGEWFSAWTNNPDDERAEGAQWVANHADRMLIIADTEALTTGSSKGAAKRALEFLIRRVQHNFGKDNVALVWTKTDFKRPKALREEVEDIFTSCFGTAPIFDTSVPDESCNGDDKTLKQLTELFSWAFTPKVSHVTMKLPKTDSDDPFISYRGNL
jgi:hypothetical protein